MRDASWFPKQYKVLKRSELEGAQLYDKNVLGHTFHVVDVGCDGRCPMCLLVESQEDETFGLYWLRDA